MLSPPVVLDGWMNSIQNTDPLSLILGPGPTVGFCLLVREALLQLNRALLHHDREYYSRHDQCHLCDVSCETCTGPEAEDCMRCSRLRLFDNGKCVIHCDAGKYAMEGHCYLCHHTCHECSDDGPTNCTSCHTDSSGVARYLFEGQCRDSCPEGHFPYHFSTRSECKACPDNCRACSSAETCHHCSTGYYPKDGDCLPLSCGEGEIEDDDHEECVTCEEGCKSCLTINRFHCNACYPDYYQSGVMCHRHCPDGTYGVKSTHMCEMCDNHCRICDESQCHWCEDNYFLADDKCVKECDEGLYGDEERRECESCHHKCRSCKGPAYDDCDSCEDGIELKRGQCVPRDVKITCQPDQYFSEKKECLPCSSDCATCSGPEPNQCDTCDSGRFLSPDQHCMRRCPAGSFGNASSRRCEECVSGCAQCENAQSCQHCQLIPRLYLSGGRCVPECKSGYPEGGVCVACEPHCEVCEGPHMCVSCLEQYLLHEHACVGHCPQRYRPAEGECVRCPDGCSDCHANNLCTDCEQYFFLHKDKCVVECPEGFYESSTTRSCDKCHSTCVACDGPDEDDCVTCSSSRPLRYRGKCLPRCPDHTYLDKQRVECRECDRTCMTCSGPLPTSCESCDKGMELDATGHCVVVNMCPSLFYSDPRGGCQPCHHTCQHCTGAKATHCLSCRPDTYLLNHTCVTQCPDGYYGDDDTHQCEQCHGTCRSCDGYHSTDCLSCPESLFQLGHTCVSDCGSGYYGLNGTCWRCEHSCGACWGHGSHCTSCKDGYFLLGAQCLYTCPDHYYPETKGHTCQQCHATCETCRDSGPIMCVSCYPGFHFMGGICSSPCLAGYYPTTLSVPEDVDVQCEACHRSCTECKGPGPSDCTECPALQRLAPDGRCLSCCGEGQRMDGGPIPWECCQCQELDDGCVMGVNFRFVDPTEQELGEALEGVVLALVLGAVAVGLVLFLVLWMRSTAPRSPFVVIGGYEKVPVQATPLPPDDMLNFRDGPDDDEDDEEEEDCDIVYMGQDGTMYRKFKYGLLDEHDDEPEMEYDDEGYTMTGISASTDTDT